MNLIITPKHESLIFTEEMWARVTSQVVRDDQNIVCFTMYSLGFADGDGEVITGYYSNPDTAWTELLATMDMAINEWIVDKMDLSKEADMSHLLAIIDMKPALHDILDEDIQNAIFFYKQANGL